ncbi:MAG: 50S ribosomal protein L4 [Firmicutes bacterium]|nr:50S ribosomal protein L4 [Bacillota bacterium]
MPNVKIYSMSGKDTGSTMELKSELFGAEYNEALVHQAVVTTLANARQGTKSTLTRSEVRGGGKKPWRQKGTGRARHGSIRSPQWKGGGVVFAPKPRDFSKKINVKAKRAALYSALSYKVANSEFIVLDKLQLKEAKTKEVAKLLKAFKCETSCMFVTVPDANVVRAANNIPKVLTTTFDLINVYDVVKSNRIFITKEAVEKFQEVHA